MEKFFLDEKYYDFLLLAQNGDNRAYAFLHKDEIVYLEDLPMNYPCITVCIVDLKGLKTIKRRLEKMGWAIHNEHIEEHEEKWGKDNV